MYLSIDNCIKYALLSAIRADSDSNKSLTASIRSLESAEYLDGPKEARTVLTRLVNDNMIAADLGCNCFYIGTNCDDCLPPVVRLAGIDFLEEQDEQTLRPTINS